MNIINIFPKLCSLFPGIIAIIIHFGMSVVCSYHLFCENPFFNTSFEEAKGLEKFANTLLVPTQYLCEGKQVSYKEGDFEIKQRFQYLTRKKLYSPLSFTLALPSIILGSTCKSAALLNKEVKSRHTALKAHLQSTKVDSNLDYYHSVGIDITSYLEGEEVIPQGYMRRPGDENNLAADKKGLVEAVKLLTEAKIPFWVDCGTCIGTYRHGGVIPWDDDLDISILNEDFQNARNVLKQLDPNKFIAQDWSGRGRPGTYLRIYIKESRNHIDVYSHDIDPVKQTVSYIIAHLDSDFMADGWKKRELEQSDPIPFNVIFPLKKGVFDGIIVPVPNQTARFIQYKYGPNIEPARIYDEKTGKYEKDHSHPYWKIPLVS